MSSRKPNCRRWSLMLRRRLRPAMTSSLAPAKPTCRQAMARAYINFEFDPTKEGSKNFERYYPQFPRPLSGDLPG